MRRLAEILRANIGRLIVGAVVLLFTAPTHVRWFDRFVEGIEFKSYDTRMVIANQLLSALGQLRPVDPRVQLIGIETQSWYRYVDEIHSRQIHAELLTYLRQAGVEAVIYDMVFNGDRDGDDLMGYLMSESKVFTPVLFSGREENISALYGDFIDAERLEQLTSETVELERLAPSEIAARLLDLTDERDELQIELENTRRSFDLPMEEIDRRVRRLEQFDLRLNKYRRWLAAKAYFKRRFAIRETEDGDEQLPLAKFVELPSGPLLLNSAGVGFINAEEDVDGVIRRHSMVYRFEGRLFPHIALAYIADHFETPLDEIVVEPGREVRLTPRRHATEDIVIPIGLDGSVLVYFSEGESLTNRAFPLDDLIRRARPPAENDAAGREHYETYVAGRTEAGFDLERLRGATVIVGENRAAGTDIRPIPLEESYSLFATHAHLLDDILRQRFYTKPPPWVGVATNILIGALVGWMILRLGYRRLVVALPALAIAYVALARGLFVWGHVSVDLARPSLILVFCSTAMMAYRVGVVEREDRMIRNFFDRMVSPEVVRELIGSHERATLYGARREATILFVDLRGFTRLLEKHDAESILDVLNEFYDRVAMAVIEYDGHVNKFIGDAVLAVFGAPQSLADPEWSAVRAALRMRDSIAELNATDRLRDLDVELKIGVGLNSGEVVVGLVGGEQSKTDYTALGDVVNVSSRLQTMALNNNILMGEETYMAVCRQMPVEEISKGYYFSKRESVQVKGRSEPINVYEIMIKDSAANRE